MDVADLVSHIEKKETFNFDETFHIYKECSILLSRNNDNNELILATIEHREKFSNKLDDILTDLIEAYGLYPYLKRENLSPTSTHSEIREAYHKSDTGTNLSFHEAQKLIFEKIKKSKKNLIVSAPTSFGKSLLIEEIVASNNYKNIIIIQPTLALLDETRKKLSKYREVYKTIVRTTQEPSATLGNIFLLTAERVNEYQYFNQVDFLIIDEFYKLSAQRDDERSDSLNNAFHHILKEFNCRFYLLGPNIDGISQGFEEKYNAEFIKTDFKLVRNIEIDIYKDHIGKFGSRGAKKLYKEETLYELLDKLSKNQNIIYCSSPRKARQLSYGFYKHLLLKKTTQKEELSIIPWIQQNVSEKWSLIEFLRYGIAFHDGALQKHITSSIIDYFEEGAINFLFCTATIIEGVNTSARNVIYFDDKKGDNPIDYFDYSNIKGRAGRMMKHYSGYIYNFSPPPSKQETFVDIPFYEQSPISNEVLIQLDDNEVIDKNSEQYINLKKIDPSELNIFKENQIHIKGQQFVLNRLREELASNYELINWTTYPSKAQLEYTLGMAYDFLAQEHEKSRTMSKKRLITLTSIYSFHESIFPIIENIYNFELTRAKEDASKQEIWDAAIRDGFQILRHWLKYKVPKWLIVMNSLQTYICSERGWKPGNYLHFASQIENDFLRGNLSILDEYGIPKSAIEKLSKYIPENANEESVINIIKKSACYKNSEFLTYEKEKIIGVVGTS
ncbi:MULTISPECIES: DEAD/DEAH box helicase [Pseudomonas]|uniref:DEAD/DEAH box helicase n=1 Tax=Pseudomonas TaxID=286 RepID=UPI000C9A3247|nr:MULTISPECIES: DEAD/DEAH box helicase [Pseudomonas]